MLKGLSVRVFLHFPEEAEIHIAVVSMLGESHVTLKVEGSGMFKNKNSVTAAGT